MEDISNLIGKEYLSFNGPIEFPALGIKIDIPKTFFGTNIHWYGIIIAVGMIIAVLVCIKFAKKEGITTDNILDVVIFGAPAGIICARLYYVIFEFDSYKDNLIDIFKIWNGGLAIYGGIIGAVISTAIYCRVKKVSIPKMFDVGAIGLLIGQAVGRWGNFVNREAFGAPTGDTFLLRMRLYETSQQLRYVEVHPTFLYESIWNLLTLVFLMIYYDKKKFDSQIFAMYVVMYGIGRAWIEGLRTDSLYVGPLRVSQILALVTAVAGIVYIIICLKKNKNKLQNEI